MQTLTRLTLLILIMLTVTTGMQAEPTKEKKGPEVVNLWPNGPRVKSSDAADRAELTVFLPEARLRTGRAVIICPGGAYSHLAMEHEGTQWAEFLCREGIAAFVLKYRMPHGDHRVPMSDAEEALRLVHRNAAKWHIDTKEIGIMGFSAGGHLASAVATHGKGETLPAFQILFYPVITMDPAFAHRGSMVNFLGDKPSKKDIRDWSSDRQVTRATPRAFIALSDDDQGVLPMNGVNYYMECYRHDVPASLHVYPTGGHGWGFRDSFDFHIEVLLELKAWLRSF